MWILYVFCKSVSSLRKNIEILIKILKKLFVFFNYIFLYGWKECKIFFNIIFILILYFIVYF